jgi:hypothetical protein
MSPRAVDQLLGHSRSALPEILRLCASLRVHLGHLRAAAVRLFVGSLVAGADHGLEAQPIVAFAATTLATATLATAAAAAAAAAAALAATALTTTPSTFSLAAAFSLNHTQRQPQQHEQSLRLTYRHQS